MNNLTILIPLYRSARWTQILRENIASHLNAGSQVILSDKHCHDDTIFKLQHEFQCAQLRAFHDDSNEGWVANINAMIGSVETDFFRILPHDDSSTARQSGNLLEAFSYSPDAVVSYGIVKKLQLETNELSYSAPRQHEEEGDNIRWGISAFGSGAYPGAFKGVVKTMLPGKGRMFIKPTKTSTCSERLWLSGLRMYGKFLLTEKEMLLKRFYEESTHRQWQREAWERADFASVLCNYINDMQLEEKRRQAYCRQVWEGEYSKYLPTQKNQKNALSDHLVFRDVELKMSV